MGFKVIVDEGRETELESLTLNLDNEEVTVVAEKCCHLSKGQDRQQDFLDSRK